MSKRHHQKLALSLALAGVLGAQALAVEARQDNFDSSFNAGVAQMQSGQLKSAEKTLQSAYKLASEFGPKDVRKARAAEQLASVLEKEGRLAAAELYYREALDIKERMHGKGNPLTGRALFNLGRVKAASGDYLNARKCLEESLDHRMSVAKEDDQPLSEILYHLGTIEGNSADLVDAREHLEQSLTIQKNLGRHDRVSNSWSQLALISIAQGKFMQAENEAIASLSVAREHSPNDALLQAHAFDVLAKCKLSLGQIDQAEGYSSNAARLIRESVGSTSEESGDNLLTSGLIRLKMKRYKEADACFSRAIDIFRLTRTDGHKSVESAYFGRSLARLRMGNFTEARSDFEHGESILKSNVGSGHNLTSSYSGIYSGQIAGNWFQSISATGTDAMDAFGRLLSDALPAPGADAVDPSHGFWKELSKGLGVLFVFLCALAFAVISPTVMTNLWPMLDLGLFKMPKRTKRQGLSRQRAESELKQYADPQPPNPRAPRSVSTRTTVTDIKVSSVDVQVWKDRLRELEQANIRPPENDSNISNHQSDW